MSVKLDACSLTEEFGRAGRSLNAGGNTETRPSCVNALSSIAVPDDITISRLDGSLHFQKELLIQVLVWQAEHAQACLLTSQKFCHHPQLLPASTTTTTAFHLSEILDGASAFYWALLSRTKHPLPIGLGHDQ